ncbi:hypothetical protein HKCCE2091_17420 [Rhodobacterales bacterium HKCCE2091]|nr:hypothetical protein [Rhodobacterales bacterium HKCCE2091]
MMNLVEIAPVDAGLLPLAALKEQLRLPAGFSDDGSADGKLTASLRAAIAAVEARTGKALLRRQFLFRVSDWAETDRQPLPVGPVASLDQFTVVKRDGTVEGMDLAAFRIVPDSHRPALAPVGSSLPTLPTGGRAELRITAGFAAAWTGVPPDLAEAVLILAADYFDMPQTDGARTPGMPAAVQVLLEPHRSLGLRRIGA